MNETLVSSLGTASPTWVDVISGICLILVIMVMIFLFRSIKKEENFAEKLVEEIKREDHKNGRK